MEAKLIIAAGGTGGHLFPAQRLAQEIRADHPDIEILFSGKGLSDSPFFDRSSFPFYEIASASPALKNYFRAIQQIGKGVWQSLLFLRREKPQLVVGFGSYHAFPLLVAAIVSRIPFILFEANLYPGKVIRLLAPFARCTAVQFSPCARYLKGKVVAAAVQRKPAVVVSRERGLERYGLRKELKTILILGGSQGAASMNCLVAEGLKSIRDLSFQILHLTGSKEQIPWLQEIYRTSGFHAFVSPFEAEMHYAWNIADLAICRAGAGTITEMIDYGVPALMIPYPHGADDHQTKNARFIAEEIKGGYWMDENRFEQTRFQELFNEITSNEACRAALIAYRAKTRDLELKNVIYEIL